MKLKTTDRTDFNTYTGTERSSCNTKQQQQEFLEARRKDGQTEHVCEVLATANCGLTLNVQSWRLSTRLCVCVGKGEVCKSGTGPDSYWEKYQDRITKRYLLHFCFCGFTVISSDRRTLTHTKSSTIWHGLEPDVTQCAGLGEILWHKVALKF